VFPVHAEMGADRQDKAKRLDSATRQRKSGPGHRRWEHHYRGEDQQPSCGEQGKSSKLHPLSPGLAESSPRNVSRAGDKDNTTV